MLSHVLRSIRLSGSLQFCLMPAGAWQTGDAPSMANFAGAAAVPFHILVEGTCWLKMRGRRTDLVPGDVVAFPFGDGHQLGAGEDGRRIEPVADLPPKPWRDIPVLRYGDGPERARLLCGYLRCDAFSFRPLGRALPPLLHVRTAAAADADWLQATIGQIVREVERPRAGGISMLERLTEIAFIEVLRHQIVAATRGTDGWLAALADPALGRCLALIHDAPARDWTVGDLAVASGLSRSSLAERFEAMLGTSPMRYVRAWRLHLAGVALGTTNRPVADIAFDAGYGTEAAFTRAFARTYGTPPAAWRRAARRAEAE